MALVIEDGTGVAGADSYGTRTGLIQHAANYYGLTIPDEDASDAPMRLAFAWLNGQTWKGTKTNGRSQTGAWPRDGVTDCESIEIADDEIPSEIVTAQYELAIAEYNTAGMLTPSGSVRDAMVSMEKVDVIAVEYDTSRMSPDDALKYTQARVEAAMRLLKCFLADGGIIGRGVYVASV